MSLLKPNSFTTRLTALDSLRGFAALSVVFHHLSGGIWENWYLNVSPFYIFISAREAVIFFFFLSGYILTLQNRDQTNFNYIEFLLKRVFRLYTPYAAAICLSLILFNASVHSSAQNAWLGRLWHTPITKQLIIHHFLLIFDFDTMALNPAIWSLVQEMRIAIIFPVLLYLIKFPPVRVFIFCMILSVLALLVSPYVEVTKGYGTGYTHTLYYSYIFIAGALTAKHQRYILHKYVKLTSSKRTVLLIVALLIYTYSHTISFMSSGSLFQNSMFVILQDTLVIAASFYFIIMGIEASKSKNILTMSLPVFFGKISYSFYLTHIPVSVFIYYNLSGKVPVFLVVLTCLSASIITAVVFNYFFEQPAQRVAKRLTGRFR